MITREREKTAAAPPAPPRPPIDGGVPWWRSWPSPAGRPRPLNRRSLSVGGLIVGVALTIIDGLLGLMAWYASHNVTVGVAVWLVLLALTGLEFSIVAWAAKKRQDLEARRAEED
jgi:hypothetical protein